MILTHHSAEPLVMEWDRTYPVHLYNGKPGGFWLSDDSEYGWAEWCQAEQFALDSLAHRTQFRVDTSRVLHLSTAMAVVEFGREHRETGPDVWWPWVDWAPVREQWAGVVITPYQRSVRFGAETFWYSGWDCASGCIWDLTAIEQVSHSMRAAEEVTP